MWKLLPIILLVSCTATDHKGTAADGNSTDGHRIVNTLNLPLNQATKPGTGQALSREFSRGGTQGWIQQTGDWHISRQVVHTRLLCATYETGIQLGKGNGIGKQACSNVEWLTDVQYGTRRTHCNSATLVHTGGGEFANMTDLFDDSTCVRVVTRCRGVC